MRSRFVISILALLMCWSTFSFVLFAQEEDNETESFVEESEEDENFSSPPSRVARLNSIKGDVLFRSEEEEEKSQAYINQPVTTADYLWTNHQAQAEMHIGSTAIRLNERTAFQFLKLDDTNIDIKMIHGTLHIRIRYLNNQENVMISTPYGVVQIQQAGSYRINVSKEQAQILIYAGSTKITLGDTVILGHTSQMITTTQKAQGLHSSTTKLPPPDDFDQWCQNRDHREDNSRSLTYVSQEMTGYEDLDDNGSWQTTAEFGVVWIPRVVAADWAPYRYGHWRHIQPWGWTWIDDASWGFAPFHYGRWVFWHSRWCWLPGERTIRPIYAPALVAFVSDGQWSVSMSAPGTQGVAWIPLGPREIYIPSYRVNRRYVYHLNRAYASEDRIRTYHSRRLTMNQYVNFRAPRSVTIVKRDAFMTARPTRRAIIDVPAHRLGSARSSNISSPLTPRREPRERQQRSPSFRQNNDHRTLRERPTPMQPRRLDDNERRTNERINSPRRTERSR